MNRVLVLSWSCRIAIAAILLQTLFFKFGGAPESVYIFSKLGAEPWGRIASGIIEAFAVVLLLAPSTAAAGALLSLATISGAILSHLTLLGIAVINSDGTSDGGLLFALALVVFVLSLVTLFIHRAQIPVLGSHLK